MTDTKKEDEKVTVKADKAPSVTASSQAHSSYIKEQLAKQEKVTIFIPLEGDAPGSTHPVCINDYVAHVPKGKMVSVPKTIADLIMTHLQATSQAVQQAQALMGKSSPEDFTL